MLSSPLQARKAILPMLLTVDGMSRLFNALHPLNAEFPMVVRLAGRVMPFSALQP